MATSVIPKSDIRIDHNIIEGYGEVPAVYIQGVLGWGLPGGRVTFSEAEARIFAKELDKEIRKRLKDPQQLLSAKI